MDIYDFYSKNIEKYAIERRFIFTEADQTRKYLYRFNNETDSQRFNDGV